MDKKDIVIASLEFAREKFLMGEGINLAQFQKYLISNGFATNDQSSLTQSLFMQIFWKDNPDGYGDHYFKLMSLDVYTSLLDYEELQLARQDSADARQEARKAITLTEKALVYTKWSLWIACGVGALQIILAIIQLLSTTNP